MTAPEFSRTVHVRPQPPERMAVTANEEERTGLAERFGICAIESLNAELVFEADGDTVRATGRMTADLVQTCAVAGDDFPVRIDERLDLRFVPEASVVRSEEEIELASSDADEIEFAGEAFDLGEAVAQSLELAIDRYAEGPNADAVRAGAGIIDEDAATRGPLAEALAKLRKG